MNILFLYLKAVQPNIGGIGRITYTLGELFRRKGHEVWYVAATRNNNESCDKCQLFVPEEYFGVEANYKYIKQVIKDLRVDIVINQEAPYLPIALLFERLRKVDDKVLLVNCFHTSVLTPAYNYAYQVEYSLRKKGLGLFFNFLR